MSKDNMQKDYETNDRYQSRNMRWTLSDGSSVPQQPEPYASKSYYSTNYKNRPIKQPISRIFPSSSFQKMRLGSSFQPESTDSVKKMTAQETLATLFFRNEIIPINSSKSIVYESIRKFGRFDMEWEEINSKENKSIAYQQVISGLSRLWQLGEGLVTVCQKTELVEKHSMLPVVNIYVFNVGKTSYEKLEKYQAEKEVLHDPLWIQEQKSNYFNFV